MKKNAKNIFSAITSDWIVLEMPGLDENDRSRHPHQNQNRQFWSDFHKLFVFVVLGMGSEGHYEL